MQLIANGTQVTSPPAAAAYSGTPGFASNTPPGPSVVPTIIDPDANNSVFAELYNLLSAAGINPAQNTFTQVRQSLWRMFAGNIASISASPGVPLTADAAGLILVNATAGNIALTMPLANAAGGRPLTVKLLRVDATTNTVTISLQGSDATLLGALAGPFSLGALQYLEFISDGSQHWILNPLPGVTVFGSSGTFTLGPGQTSVEAEVWGAGGGSGSTTGGLTNNGGSTGGGGGYARKRISGLVPGASVTVTVGTGGTGGTTGGAAPTAGGTSSFGPYVSASGGAAGTNGTGGGPGSGVAAGGGGSGGDENWQGQAGAASGNVGGVCISFGGGGAFKFPSIPVQTFEAAGVTPPWPGVAGGPGVTQTAVSRAGGTGANGLVIVRP